MTPHMPLTAWSAFLFPFALFCLYGLWLAIYRLLLSPISGFPGPKLAAATGWYQSYFELFTWAKGHFKVKQLHDKYGAVVRINPWEISINDAEFYSVLNVSDSVRRTNLDVRQRAALGFGESHGFTEDHHLHKIRRKPLESLFSRRAIDSTQDTIWSFAARLDELFSKAKNTGHVISLNRAFSAFVDDAVSHASFGKAIGLLEDDDFSPLWHRMLHGLGTQTPLLFNFPILPQLLNLLPVSVVAAVHPEGAAYAQLKQYTESIEETSITSRKLIETILLSDLPDSQKTRSRLATEASVVLAAGGITTMRMLTIIAYYLLADPAKEKRMRYELAPLMAGYPNNKPRWADLEKLPYLAACVKEALRLGIGATRHAVKYFPHDDIKYREWVIPKGTSISVPMYPMHYDEEVYPSAWSFIPERWLGEYDPRMDRNLNSFSKGSRVCLGKNLAYANMYILLATLFHSDGPKMTLYETNESDVKFECDFGVSGPRLESKGVRVVIG
ncbi:putative cytochrome P450 E-class, group IV [Cladorrhinum sp. PSN259]|nr:putative cytochrome P450 E-class, group IV [Cladorrhinum sp. PSN259]